jgi:predicted amidohydrolase
MKTAIFQCDGAGLTPQARLGKLARAIEGQGLDLVVCPELFMSGYHVGEQLHELAEPADGRLSQQAAQLARTAGTAIVYGYPERDGDSVFNSALAIGADGTTLANHRKLAIPPGSEEGWFAPGQGLTLFQLGGMTCGLLICYDAEFPEAVRAACLAGAEAVIVPTALSDQWDQVADRVMPARAFENGCWVLYANHAGAENGLAYHGGSCIVGPQGRDAARAGAAEQLITATIDAASVAAARARLPYFRDLQDLTPRLA